MVYRVGDLELDRLSHRVARAEQEIDLAAARVPPARIPHEACRPGGHAHDAAENVWDYHFDPQTNVIDVHISRLRSKIDKGFAQPLLHTVRARATWCVKAMTLWRRPTKGNA